MSRGTTARSSRMGWPGSPWYRGRTQGPSSPSRARTVSTRTRGTSAGVTSTLSQASPRAPSPSSTESNILVWAKRSFSANITPAFLRCSHEHLAAIPSDHHDLPRPGRLCRTRTTFWMTLSLPKGSRGLNSPMREAMPAARTTAPNLIPSLPFLGAEAGPPPQCGSRFALFAMLSRPLLPLGRL